MTFFFLGMILVTSLASIPALRLARRRHLVRLGLRDPRYAVRTLAGTSFGWFRCSKPWELGRTADSCSSNPHLALYSHFSGR